MDSYFSTEYSQFLQEVERRLHVTKKNEDDWVQRTAAEAELRAISIRSQIFSCLCSYRRDASSKEIFSYVDLILKKAEYTANVEDFGETESPINLETFDSLIIDVSRASFSEILADFESWRTNGKTALVRNPSGTRSGFSNPENGDSTEVS